MTTVLESAGKAYTAVLQNDVEPAQAATAITEEINDEIDEEIDEEINSESNSELEEKEEVSP